MAEMSWGNQRLRWQPVILGALGALAVWMVLSFFGMAFGAGGYGTLSGIWLVLTPVVACWAGAVVATSLGGRDESNWLSGAVVWCLWLVGSAIFLTAGWIRLGWTGTSLVLAGLACLFGLGGAILGAGMGRNLATRSMVGVSPRRDVRDRPYTPPLSSDTTDRPEIRH